MPSIHLFGKKSLSGGDDLQVPCLSVVALRLLQLLCLLVPIWFAIDRVVWSPKRQSNDDNAAEPSCDDKVVFDFGLVTYASASTAYAVLDLLLELRLAVVSSQGTPTEPGTRTRQVQRLLEFKLLPLTVLEGLICVFGVALFALNRTTCDLTLDAEINDNDGFWMIMNEYNNDDEILLSRRRISGLSWWWFVCCLLWVTQVTEVLVTGALLIRLLCFASSPSSPAPPSYHAELTEEMWVDRCSAMCRCLGMTTCFLFGGKEVAMGDYGDIARALSDYLETGGVLDLVPSDIVMGFWVLQRLQRKRILEAREAVKQQKRLDASGATGTADATVELLALSTPTSLPKQQQDRLLLQPSSSSASSHSVHRQRLTYLVHNEEGAESFYFEAQSRKVLSRRSEYDVQVLREGARFAKYALAIYTWMLYVYQHPIAGVPRLVCRNPCCCFSRGGRRRDGDCCGDDEEVEALLEETGRVVGDNCCRVHKKALLLHSNLDEVDLVYAQLKNSFNEVPYCIMLDHAWKSVVVAIRGTFSLEDCVTDVLIDPEPLDTVGHEFGFDGDGQKCHGGVLACARIVYRDLQRHELLDRLLSGNTARYPGYKLRIVGHSLGAATATVLSYMLKQKFPTLRCVNYSPPGVCLTWKLATDCQDFCTSFVLDSDLVPRLSLNSMDHLRDEILDLIGRVKVPKIQVVNKVMRGTGLLSCRLCVDDDLEEDREALQQSIEEMLYNRDEVPRESDYQHQLHQFRNIQSDRKQRRGETRSVSLYPPGRIVHLLKTGEKTSCMHGVAKCLTCGTSNVGAIYAPVFAKNDDFNEIVVSPTMGTDHFPNRVCFEMEAMAEEYGIDTTRCPYLVDVEAPMERS